MIQCQYCDEWFHIDCIGINKSSFNKIKKFMCGRCCLLGTNLSQARHLSSLDKTPRLKTLISNSANHRTDVEVGLEKHREERYPVEKWLYLCDQVRELSKYIILDEEEERVLQYQESYRSILEDMKDRVKECEMHLLEFEGDGNLKNFKKHLKQISKNVLVLLGMPFYPEELVQFIQLHRKVQFMYFVNKTIFHISNPKALGLGDFKKVEYLLDGIWLELPGPLSQIYEQLVTEMDIYDELNSLLGEKNKRFEELFAACERAKNSIYIRHLLTGEILHVEQLQFSIAFQSSLINHQNQPTGFQTGSVSNPATVLSQNPVDYSAMIPLFRNPEAFSPGTELQLTNDYQANSPVPVISFPNLMAPQNMIYQYMANFGNNPQAFQYQNTNLFPAKPKNKYKKRESK